MFSCAVFNAVTLAKTAFAMLEAGTLTSAELFAALGTTRVDYAVTETTAMMALNAKNDGKIDTATLLEVLNGK